MGARKSPRSNRGVYLVKIANRNVASRLKITTGDFLGLKAQDKPVDGKRQSIKTGAKGTKSFQLVLKNSTTIDGVRIQRLSFPVDGKVTVKAFYAYAKLTFNGKGVGGIITPDGRLFAWAKITRPSPGILPRLPSLPSLPNLDLGDLVSPELGQQVGGYLGGTLGGAPGAAIGGMLGGYLADFV